MRVRSLTLLGSFALAAQVLLLSGCVSFYTAGQFGHEVIPLPPPSPPGASGPTASTWVSLEAEAFSSVMADDDYAFTEDDHAFMGEAAVLEMVQFPLEETGAVSLAAGAGGFLGVTVLGNELAGAGSAGLLPGNFLFYGGTVQVAGAIDFFTPVLLGVGIQAGISYESGPYAAARRLLSETPPDDSWVYVDLSRSGFSGMYLSFFRIGSPPRERGGFTVTYYCGYGDPDLFAKEDSSVLSFVPIYGVSYRVTARRLLFFLNGEIMGVLNSGFSFGMAYRVM